MCSLREFCVFDGHAWKRVHGQKMALRDPLVPKNIEDPKSIKNLWVENIYLFTVKISKNQKQINTLKMKNM